MALSTASTMTPTSAKTAHHMVAMPTAPRIRNSDFDAQGKDDVLVDDAHALAGHGAWPRTAWRGRRPSAPRRRPRWRRRCPARPWQCPRPPGMSTGASLMPSPTKARLQPLDAWRQAGLPPVPPCPRAAARHGPRPGPARRPRASATARGVAGEHDGCGRPGLSGLAMAPAAVGLDLVGNDDVAQVQARPQAT